MIAHWKLCWRCVLPAEHKMNSAKIKGHFGFTWSAYRRRVRYITSTFYDTQGCRRPRRTWWFVYQSSSSSFFPFDFLFDSLPVLFTIAKLACCTHRISPTHKTNLRFPKRIYLFLLLAFSISLSSFFFFTKPALCTIRQRATTTTNKNHVGLGWK